MSRTSFEHIDVPYPEQVSHKRVIEEVVTITRDGVTVRKQYEDNHEEFKDYNHNHYPYCETEEDVIEHFETKDNFKKV